MSMKTKKQKEREKRHSKVVALFLELNAEGGSREALWEIMESKTHYSRKMCQLILIKNGIDYKTR